MRWLAALAMVLGKDDVIPYLREILQPIHRELDISTTFKGNLISNISYLIPWAFYSKASFISKPSEEQGKL
jgi:hypothetical protein